MEPVARPELVEQKLKPKTEADLLRWSDCLAHPRPGRLASRVFFFGDLMNTMTTTTRLMRLPEVKRVTGLGRSTIYALVDAGKFPRQRKITPTIAVWSEAEVDAWITRVIATNCAEASTT